MADLALKFPTGTRVKYFGTQAKKEHHGKIAMVYGYLDANGLKLKYEEDGSLGVSIPRNVKIVPPPNPAPN